MMVENYNFEKNRRMRNINYSIEEDPLEFGTEGKTDIASIVNECLDK